MAGQTIPLSIYVDDASAYPQPSSGGTIPGFTRGMLHVMAADVHGFAAPAAQGQKLAIANNQTLYSILGHQFGGSSTDFALPDIAGRSAIGGKAVGVSTVDTLSLTWLIAPDGIGQTPPAGALMPFAGSYCPEGWLVADGSRLPIGGGLNLFFVIGTLFGGDGTNDYALPDMTGVAACGAGQTGGANLPVGAKLGGAVPGLAINYIIALNGLYPAPGSDFSPNSVFTGQILAFAGLDAPQDWALCDGSLLAIATNKPLYNLIGNQFGGDGTTTFALPDLRGARIVGR